jgi:hypothetical protein
MASGIPPSGVYPEPVEGLVRNDRSSIAVIPREAVYADRGIPDVIRFLKRFLRKRNL